MGARCSIATPSRRARPMPINSARFAELRQSRDTAEARFRAAEARVGELNAQLTARTRILGEQGDETEEIRALNQRIAEERARSERERGAWAGLTRELDADLRAVADRGPQVLI